MRVRCVLCDQMNQIDDESLMAKILKNRPIHTYMCPSCEARIAERTKERWATGKFTIYHRNQQQQDEW